MPRAFPVVVVLCAMILTSTPCLAQGGDQSASPQKLREMAAAGENFRGAVLSGKDLSAIRVGDMDLAGTNWTRADLRGAVFSGTALTGASLDEVIGRGASFQRCRMVNATIRNGDLSGASFEGTQLAGADFSGTRLHGASFEGCTYSRSGGLHSGAIAAALGVLASGPGATGAPPFSPTIAAGLMVEPFSFVYNTADPSQWPMAPFTESPVRAAVKASGHDGQATFDQPADSAVELLMRSLRAGKVCLLPLSLAGEEMTGGDFQRAFWGAAIAVNEADKPTRVVVLVPPFGRREYTPTQLIPRWQGPWPTLEPFGAERSTARFPIWVLSRGETPRSPRETILHSLRNAVGAARDPRTYTTYVPGVKGLEGLSADLARAADATVDTQMMTNLSVWADRPLALLISARTAASDYLREAAAAMLDADRVGMLRASELYRAEAEILRDRFPKLKPGDTVTVEELRERFAQASKVIEEVASIEASAADALYEVVDE